MKLEGIPNEFKHDHDLSVTLKLDVDVKDTINEIVTATACTAVCAVGFILLLKKVIR